MTHAECVVAANSWLIPKCHFTMPEFFTHNNELPDVIGFGASDRSIVIECKVSRGDFLKDKYKQFRMVPEMGMGSERYYCCPKDLIKPEELPDNWGLIYVYPSGYTKKIKDSNGHKRNLKAEHHLLYYYAKRAYFAGVHKTILDYRGYDR